MITIRRFTSEDQKPVTELVAQIMNEEFHDEKAAYPTEDIDNIGNAYGALGEAFFVALSGQKLIGTVGIKKEDDRIALMRRLFVAAPYRRQQIGVKLIDKVFQFCDEVGYKEIVFRTTSRMEGANRICQKCGFTQRAKLQLGPIELFKFSLSLRNGVKG